MASQDWSREMSAYEPFTGGLAWLVVMGRDHIAHGLIMPSEIVDGFLHRDALLGGEVGKLHPNGRSITMNRLQLLGQLMTLR